MGDPSLAIKPLTRSSVIHRVISRSTETRLIPRSNASTWKLQPALDRQPPSNMNDPLHLHLWHLADPLSKAT